MGLTVMAVVRVGTAYMYCTYAENDSSYYATVYGRSDGTSARSCSNTYKYYDGCKRYQSNNVKENGYDRAFFRGEYENKILGYIVFFINNVNSCRLRKKKC